MLRVEEMRLGFVVSSVHVGYLQGGEISSSGEGKIGSGG
jgi:hypothetical protein